eukprot:Platyproteum_vivax@DN7005_c0_g3_i1.p1
MEEDEEDEEDEDESDKTCCFKAQYTHNATSDQRAILFHITKKLKDLEIYDDVTYKVEVFGASMVTFDQDDIQFLEKMAKVLGVQTIVGFLRVGTELAYNNNDEVTGYVEAGQFYYVQDNSRLVEISVRSEQLLKSVSPALLVAEMERNLRKKT